MKIKGITIFLPIGFVILLLLVLLALPVRQDSVSQIRFQDSTRNFSLSLYYDEDTDKQYLFLPTFLSVRDLTLSCPWYIHAELTTDSQELVDISETSLDTDFFLTVKALGQKQHHTIRILQCSARKTITIQAQGGLMEHIIADKSHKGNVSVAILDEMGKTEFEGSSTISGRGNGTWTWEKKPYNLDFSQKISFGPFQDIQKLCLFAEYTDESKLRNAIAFQTGALQGIPFTSPYCYADIYVNGQYLGLYGLATKDTYQTDSNIRAVFEIPSEDNIVHFRTDLGNPIKVHYGLQSDIEDRLQEMEAAITAGSWYTLSNILDLESFSKKYVLDEFLCNLDTGFASQYYYLDTSGVVHCMLPWDYEWSLFSRNYHFEWLSERQIAAYFYSDCWWQDLLVFPEFREALCAELSQNYTSEFLTALDEYTGQCIAEMGISRACDSIRWPGFSSGYSISSGFTELSQFQALFREYYPRRIAFLLDYWTNPESFVKITLRRSEQESVGLFPYQYNYFFPKGTILSDYESQILRATPDYADWEFLGWYSDSGIPLEEIGPVTEELTLIGVYNFYPGEDSSEEILSGIVPAPAPEDSANTSDDAPSPDAAVPPAAPTEDSLSSISETLDPVPPAVETTDTAPVLPISTISVAFSGLFLVFLCAVILGECKRIYRQKEVYSPEHKSKSLSK